MGEKAVTRREQRTAASQGCLLLALWRNADRNGSSMPLHQPEASVSLLWEVLLALVSYATRVPAAGRGLVNVVTY